MAPLPRVLASEVDVTLFADDANLVIGQTTHVHLFAQVSDGVQDNGLYAYALNILASSEFLLKIIRIEQLGNPLSKLSDDGTIGGGSVRDLYGGDGDFFVNQNRGIGAPFELVRIEIQALDIGNIMYSAAPADIAVQLGIPAGVLLQQPGTPKVNFNNAVLLTIVPEPTTAMLLGFAIVILRLTHRRIR